MPTRPRRAPAGDGLFIVGLIGQAGSGKSTVARVFEHDGARVIDADGLGHRVVDEDAAVRAGLINEYGRDIYTPAGLDRARVAAVVFRDPAARERLNRLVHPRIVERLYAGLESLREQGYRGVVIVDAALLLDWGFERECDAVLAVTADRATQLERLQQQRGWSAADAALRLAAQREPTVLVAAADAVIHNAGGTGELEQVARDTLEALLKTSPAGQGSE